jgi:CheY-specific phosphatase CheX
MVMAVELGGIINLIFNKQEIAIAIQTAIKNTLQGYANSVILEKSIFVKAKNSNLNLNVVGIIRLNETIAPKKSVVLALGFSEKIFRKVYENTFKEKLHRIESEHHELAGELINIIFQTIDPELRTHGYLFNAELPQILTGSKLVEWSRTDAENSLILPFEIDGDTFFFELAEHSEGGL